MRIVQATGGIPVYYDRPGTMTGFTIDIQDEPPHARKLRGMLPIPPGYKLFIPSVMLRVIRQSAADTPGTVWLRILWRRQEEDKAILASVTLTSNVVGDVKEVCLPSLGVLTGTGKIVIESEDDSTGGTVRYTASMGFYQFV